MKAIDNGLLKSRITRLGGFSVLLIALGGTVGWSNPKQYQLGGGWIGSRAADGFLWNLTQSPSDPAGKSAAMRVAALTWAPGYSGILAAFGADTVSDVVGEMRMINRDTAKFTMHAYEQVTATRQIAAIEVYSGTFTFTGPDSAVAHYTLTIYPASADADGDGFPDEGAVPAFTIPGTGDMAKRVPVQ